MLKSSNAKNIIMLSDAHNDPNALVVAGQIFQSKLADNIYLYNYRENSVYLYHYHYHSQSAVFEKCNVKGSSLDKS